MNKGNHINQYQDSYLSQYDIEVQMVMYRRQLVMERLNVFKRGAVVEVGREFYGITAKCRLPNLVAIEHSFDEGYSYVAARSIFPES